MDVKEIKPGDLRMECVLHEVVEGLASRWARRIQRIHYCSAASTKITVSVSERALANAKTELQR